MRRTADAAVAELRVRFDKWLWAARFYKTRSLAAQAIESGRARVADERVKPARLLKLGERVELRKSGLRWQLEVTALSDRRGAALEAAKLYRESAASLAAREAEIANRKAAALTAPTSTGRPTKRERRKLQEFLEEG
jgi:ribosome-associated heat shock protein Hsp15